METCPRKKNPFVCPTPLEKLYLQELAQIAKICYQRGWAWATSGNFSLRGHGSGLLWQSPSGVPKEELSWQAFVPLDLATGEALRPESPRVSEETPVHLRIYQAIASARCVVHAHPRHTVAASCQGVELYFQGQEMLKAIGCRDFDSSLQVPIAPNQTREGLVAFCRGSMDKYLQLQAQLIVFAKHGVYAWGKTPRDAFKNLEALEVLCTHRCL